MCGRASARPLPRLRAPRPPLLNNRLASRTRVRLPNTGHVEGCHCCCPTTRPTEGQDVKPRQSFLLATLLFLGAAVSAVVPVHPLFNQRAGPVVLVWMGLLSATVGLAVWILARR